jgi:hypothetical protein
MHAHAAGSVIHVPDTRSVIHIDEVKHAPSVPELRRVVKIRFRENATVTFVPVVWGHYKPRIANLRTGKVRQSAPGPNCANRGGGTTHM